MKYKRGLLWITLSTIVLLVGGTHLSNAEEHMTVRRHAKKINLLGLEVEKELSATLVGSGIEGIVPSSLSLTDSGGSIQWVKIRERVDDLGMRHVFYRQHYTPPIGLVTANSPAAAAGIWLVGAELGLHYDAEGQLIFAFGTMYDDVVSTTTPTIGASSDAYSTARTRAAEWPGFSVADPREVSQQFAASDLSRVRLLLLSEDPESFRYAWEVPVRASSGSVHIANMDAATGSILSLFNTVTWSACEPDNDDQDAAEGEAQNSAIDDRDIWATELDSPGPTYTHEAHKKATSSIPDIQVFYYAPGPAACDGSDAKYAMVQVETSSGTPTYPNTSRAKNATDAIYFTERTMQTFDDWGRDGWDDNGGDALIEVQSLCWDGSQKYNNALFNYSYSYNWMPDPAVAICQKSGVDYPYTTAAAIDVVAHEWGHGVVYTSANWNRAHSDPAVAEEAKVFHEAWADVIAHAVEWDNQSAGSGYEKAEWIYGEDYHADFEDAPRRPDEDDKLGSYMYHKDDTTGGGGIYHKALPLSVAFYLMSYGGENPVCDEQPTLDGCGDVEVSEIPVAFASRIMFDALTNYMSSSHGWDDFGNLARGAAYSRFSDCPSYNGSTEQQAVIDAFMAIGYPPSSSSPIACK